MAKGGKKPLRVCGPHIWHTVGSFDDGNWCRECIEIVTSLMMYLYNETFIRSISADWFMLNCFFQHSFKACFWAVGINVRHQNFVPNNYSLISDPSLTETWLQTFLAHVNERKFLYDTQINIIRFYQDLVKIYHLCVLFAPSILTNYPVLSINVRIDHLCVPMAPIVMPSGCWFWWLIHRGAMLFSETEW